MAEGAGFEPARACTQHAFQACALNRSAIPPEGRDYSHATREIKPVDTNLRQLSLRPLSRFVVGRDLLKPLTDDIEKVPMHKRPKANRP